MRGHIMSTPVEISHHLVEVLDAAVTLDVSQSLVPAALQRGVSLVPELLNEVTRRRRQAIHSGGVDTRKEFTEGEAVPQALAKKERRGTKGPQ